MFQSPASSAAREKRAEGGIQQLQHRWLDHIRMEKLAPVQLERQGAGAPSKIAAAKAPFTWACCAD